MGNKNTKKRKAKSTTVRAPAQLAREPRAASVVLKNISTESFTVNLTHEGYCRHAGECFCQQATLRLNPQQSDGSGGYQERKVRRPASVIILAKSSSRPLHRAVLQLPGVRVAMRAPHQRLVEA